ncbi:MAG: DoxX family protein [Myxococcales bacterium]
MDRKTKLIYWISTSIIFVLMFGSGLTFAFATEAFQRFGLPDWFRVELTAAKLIGAMVLVLPRVPAKIREFAYFGFGLTIVSADIAHLSSGDTAWYLLPHATFLGLLFTSYRLFPRVHGGESPDAAATKLADAQTMTARTA